MVAPGCENVLCNFFPVPLMLAALGALQWKRDQHMSASGASPDLELQLSQEVFGTF